MPAEQRQTAIVVLVPSAEPIVSEWRERLDSSAAEGMPAHMTVLYPFLPLERVDEEVLARLCGMCASLPPLDVTFGRTARFPDVLYLEPDPTDGLRLLTSAIAARWPEAPPYEGRFADVVPHLTVARDVAEGVLAEVEVELRVALPIHARLEAASLYAYDGERWRRKALLPFLDAR